MGYKIGMPCLKLNTVGRKSSHCGNLRSVAEEALKERKGWDPDINPERTAMNQYEGMKTAAELIQYSDKHIAELHDSRGRKLRADSVRMIATVIKPPAAYMEELTPEERHQFLKDAKEIFAGIVGESHIKSVAFHYDEQGSHAHIFWEPMTEDGRLCAKEVFNLKMITQINSIIPIKMRTKGWDIDDCHLYDKTKEEALSAEDREQAFQERHSKTGRDSHEYKLQAEQELDKAKEELKAIYDETAGISRVIDKEEKQVTEYLKQIHTDRPELSQQYLETMSRDRQPARITITQEGKKIPMVEIPQWAYEKNKFLIKWLTGLKEAEKLISHTSDHVLDSIQRLQNRVSVITKLHQEEERQKKLEKDKQEDKKGSRPLNLVL